MDATSIHGATETRHNPKRIERDLTWSGGLQVWPELNFGPIKAKVDRKASSDMHAPRLANLVRQSTD